MTYKEIFIGWAGSMIGIISLSLLMYNNPAFHIEEQIGYTYQQLEEMKAECEQDLPRNVECSVVVYYLPQAELEKTE